MPLPHPSEVSVWDSQDVEQALYTPNPNGAANTANSRPVNIASDQIGAPLTGATIPTGGSGFFGWFSAIRKSIDDQIGAPITGVTLGAGGSGVAGWLSDLKNSLAKMVTGLGSVGTDASVNKPTLPTVGANFAASGPFASFVKIATMAANASRAEANLANYTAGTIVFILDDGTASSGAARNNASVHALTGVGSAVRGDTWFTTAFKGRIEVYAPANLTGNDFVTFNER